MSYATGMGIGKELCESLGLDIKGILTIDIHVAAREVVTVTVKRLVTDEQARAMNRVFEKYLLHEVTAERKGDVVPMEPSQPEEDGDHDPSDGFDWEGRSES